MLILVLAANTSFADFPSLASFHAGDHFLPRQLTRYGDRFVFSNGIVVLAGFAALLVMDLRRQRHPTDPALRDRCIHVIHVLPGGDGQAPLTNIGAGMAERAGHQRVRRARYRADDNHHRCDQVRRWRLHHPCRYPGDACGLLKVNHHYKETSARSS